MQTIVAAVDVSRASQLAFKQALVLATSMRAELVAVAVTPKYEGNMNRLTLKNTNNELSRPFLKCLTDAAEYAASLGLKIDTVHRIGLPSEEIVRVAEEVNARYLLLGSPHRSHVERVLLGRTIARVIENSPCDVLLIPESAEIRFGRILVGVSGSQASMAAAVRAMEMSREYGGQLHGVTVIDIPVERSLRYGVMNDAWQRGLSVQESLKKLAAEEEVPITAALRENSPALGLLQYAGEKDIHLIVLGTNGRRWVNDLFLDSVIERVASSAPCPVLVVNKRNQERMQAATTDSQNVRKVAG